MLRGILIALLCAGACARDQAELARASRRAEPHLALFGDFDAWARRARASATQRTSLAETSFAPLRLERSVLGAWIEARGAHAEQLSLPPDTLLPQVADWVVLRDAHLGEIGVHVALPCALEVPRWWRPAPEHGCVLISREAASAAGERLRVTMAFVASDLDDDPASSEAQAAERAQSTEPSLATASPSKQPRRTPAPR